MYVLLNDLIPTTMFFIIILSILFGGVLMLVLQASWVYWYVKREPKEPIPRKHLYDRVKQMSDLLDPSILFKKETCHTANALISFLFSELKDTVPVRRWIVKKMNVEFEELLNAKTAGKILEQITVRDYCLGPSFPVLNSVTLMKFCTAEGTEVPETVDVAVDLEYGGGFRVSVDVDLVFGTSAYVSVTVTKLKGRARLQFARNPYTHWSFSFYEEPDLEFDIQTHFEGRIVPQLGSLIINQLRKTMRKKHTLPAYKIRNKPFFPKPPPPSDSEFHVHDSKITLGRMQVTVVECSRLPVNNQTGNSEIYVTLCADSHAWSHEDIEQRFHGDTLEIEIFKGGIKNVGVTFSRGIYNKEVVVATIIPDTQVAQSELRKGDVVLDIDGVKVTSARQAAKVVRQAKEKFVIKVQRPMNVMEHLPVTSAGYDQSDYRNVQDMGLYDNDYEDFINVNIMNSLGIKDDEGERDQDGAQAAMQRLQVPSLDSPVVQRRNKQPTTSDGRRLSSSLDYETVKQLSSQQDNEDRLKNLKKVIKDTIHPLPKSEKSKDEPPPVVMVKSEPNKIPDMDLDTISISSLTSQLEEVDAAPTGPTSTIPAEMTVGPDDIQETCLVSSAADPKWDETFTFNLGESDNFLNVCVWNRLAMAVGERDMLIGYASVCLMDIALQCVSTLSGEHLELFKLQPSEQRGGATRIASQMHLFTHPGFDNRLGYGDITLFFHHLPFEESTKLAKEGSVDRPEHAAYDGVAKPKIASEERAKAPNLKKAARPDDLSLHGHGQGSHPHKFIGTQFSSPTRCDFCGKKVWTKYALQCKLCKLICHKKCSEKTQASIPCDRNRASRRPDQASPTRDASHQKQAESVAQALSNVAGRRSTPHPSPNPSPAPSPHESEASSDEEKEEEDVEAMVRRLSKLKRRLRQINSSEGNRVDDTDAMVMTAVREMGRELFLDLPAEERKEKLETMINKLQMEIDTEADRQLRLAKEIQQSRRRKQKVALEGALAQSEERMQTLANLMLHFCAGIQHCNEMPA